jgi:hypothetical protein
VDPPVETGDGGLVGTLAEGVEVARGKATLVVGVVVEGVPVTEQVGEQHGDGVRGRRAVSPPHRRPATCASGSRSGARRRARSTSGSTQSRACSAPSHVSPADPSATLCCAVYLAEYDAWPWGTAGGRRAAALAELPLEALSDPGTTLEHLDRIAEATDRDRVLAISGTKALIEATTRLTLHELGEPVDERTDPPTLIKQA